MSLLPCHRLCWDRDCHGGPLLLPLTSARHHLGWTAVSRNLAWVCVDGRRLQGATLSRHCGSAPVEVRVFINTTVSMKQKRRPRLISKNNNNKKRPVEGCETRSMFYADWPAQMYIICVWEILTFLLIYRPNIYFLHTFSLFLSST